MSYPLAYLISWRCYGTWLHGEDGAFDPQHNTYGTPPRRRNEFLVEFERNEMRYPPMSLSPALRDVCAQSIARTAAAKNWTLLAANVRTNHVHVVIAAGVEPEVVLRTLKAWCTRDIREAGLVDPKRPIWSRHGSNRYLWTEESVARACWYVDEMQDEPRP